MAEFDALKAKIPGEETGIEIKHSICAICSPAPHCGLSCYVKDGKVIKVEGWKEHPDSNGGICTKGRSNKEFLYREDRILYPMRRVGERGEGKFERITWEEAYKEIAKKLNGVKAQYGADKVAFYSGYNKWYRSMLARFAHSFGTQSYGTEHSSCFASGLMAWQCATGMEMGMNLMAKLFIGWAANGYYSMYKLPMGIEKLKALTGMKYIVVDPRITPASARFADLHLRPRLGTDGALALTIANQLIQNGWINKEYIDKYVHGFERYAESVKEYTLEKGEELTGVPADQIWQAVEMIRDAQTMSISESSAPLAHHHNGMQNYRCIMSLLAITGNIGTPGGQNPSEGQFAERTTGYTTHEHEFMFETYPENADKAVGADVHPLWYELRRDMQANDLAQNILNDDEKSIKAIYAHGMNYRMFAEDGKVLEAFKKLDFFVDVDLFMTDSAKWADIVLPCCTSLERSEFKGYPGCHIMYTKPVVQPLGESKRDVDIIVELANVMGIDDPLLCSGYENCVKHIFRDLPVDLDMVMASDEVIKIEGEGVGVKSGQWYMENGWRTPTGKIELYSEVIGAHPEWGLNPLPSYTPPINPDPEKYPFMLCSGARLPNVLHSRLHGSPWQRSLLPDPTVEMNPADCEKLGIEMGDDVEIVTSIGSMKFKANPSHTIKEGQLFVYHGYPERDINSIIPYREICDPYSGYPAYRSVYCTVRRVD